MNRLFKRGGGDDVAISPTDHAPPQAANQQPPRRKWGRKKHEQEQPQLEIPFTLPPTDNFRTSLIMPGLSTRFSMLREADDPFSLIGKASDDSVVPRSRPSPLDDIAEVSSLSARSFRPPFAEGHRTASYTSDGYATDDDSSFATGTGTGSIMSRARPGEGNNLFGGRQKIYKIPVGDSGSVNTLGGGESRGMRGRALYEDDVSMSAFQRLRLRERQAEQDRKQSDAGLCDDADRKDSLSISVDDEKRHTASSTNSGPSMLSAASTTATSITSPGLSPSNPPSQAPSPNPGAFERSKFGSKRLYESKLDQHQQESQLANATRINSVQRRTSTNQGAQRYPLSAKSTPDLRQPRDRSASATQPITELPLEEALTTFESLRGARNPSPNPARPQFNSSPSDEAQDPLAQAISTADRGKATALGAFNRPKQQFDEQQFLQRQQSLMKQRAESRSPSGSTRPSEDQHRPSFDVRPDSSRGSTDTHRPSVESRFRPPFTRAERSYSSSSPTQAGSRPSSSRSRDPATASSPTKVRRGNLAAPPSAPAPPPPQLTAARTLPPAEDLHEDTDSDYSDAAPEKLRPSGSQSPPRISLDRGEPSDVPQPLRPSPPPLLDHPALRASQEAPKTLREKRSAWNPDMKFADFRTGEDFVEQPSVDVPVSAPGAGAARAQSEMPLSSNAGLSGVRAHMRTVSEASSIYPTPTLNNYSFEDEEPVPSLPSFDKTLALNPPKATVNEQAWPGAQSKEPQVTAKVPSAPAFDSNGELDERGHADLAEWERELHKHHTRNDSATTQAERDAFADELAHRQRAIRENLKIKVDNTSRSSSPSSNKNSSVLESSLRPFGLLRTKSSRDSFKPEDTLRNKLDKSKNAVSSDLVSSGANGPTSPVPMGRTLHSRMPAPRQSEEQTRQPRHRSRPRQNSLASNATRDESLAPPHRVSTDPDSGSSTRDRSVSGASTGRSVERPRGMSGELSGRSHTLRGKEYNVAEEDFGPQTRDRSASAMSSRLRPGHVEAAPKSSVEIMGVRSSNSDSSSEPKTSLDRPSIHIDTHSHASRSTAASPLTDASGTTPTSSTSATFQRGEGGTITSGAYGGAAGRNLPPATFTFPARTAAQKAQKRPTQHSKTVLKSDISEPTLLSSTSNVDMIPLPPGASLANGATSDVDAVLAAQQAALAHPDQGGIILSSVPVGPIHPATSSVGTPNSSALSPSDRTSSATTTTASSDLMARSGSGSGASGRKSPPIGLISAEQGPLPSSISPPPLPPPFPDMGGIGSASAGLNGGKKRTGFSFFKRSNASKSGGASMHEHTDADGSARDDAKEAAFDDFVLRPSGGRLRIRKVSDETLGMNGRRRHQLVAAPDDDEDGSGMQGGMI